MKLGMFTKACNALGITLETKGGELIQILGQPKLHAETLSPKTKNKQNKGQRWGEDTHDDEKYLYAKIKGKN